MQEPVDIIHGHGPNKTCMPAVPNLLIQRFLELSRRGMDKMQYRAEIWKIRAISEKPGQTKIAYDCFNNNLGELSNNLPGIRKILSNIKKLHRS